MLRVERDCEAVRSGSAALDAAARCSHLGAHTLRVRSRTVDWLAGNELQRTFSAPARVRQALWISFGDNDRVTQTTATDVANASTGGALNKPSTQPMPADLVLLHADGVLIHTMEGDIYGAVPPCAGKALQVVLSSQKAATLVDANRF